MIHAPDPDTLSAAPPLHAIEAVTHWALVAPVELPPALERLRRAHVPTATLGVPAHVTLVHPFVPAGPLGPDARGRLAHALTGSRAFGYALGPTASWPDVLYLKVRPAEPFEDLRATLLAALAGAIPHDPSDGDQPMFIPHVTLAEGELPDVRRPFEDVTRSVDSVVVLVEGADQRWRTRWRFRLRG